MEQSRLRCKVKGHCGDNRGLASDFRSRRYDSHGRQVTMMRRTDLAFRRGVSSSMAYFPSANCHPLGKTRFASEYRRQHIGHIMRDTQKFLSCQYASNLGCILSFKLFLLSVENVSQAKCMIDTSPLWSGKQSPCYCTVLRVGTSRVAFSELYVVASISNHIVHEMNFTGYIEPSIRIRCVSTASSSVPLPAQDF